MLLSCRAITHLLEVLPKASPKVAASGAVALFCERLQTIEFIDVAEQSLMVMPTCSCLGPNLDTRLRPSLCGRRCTSCRWSTLTCCSVRADWPLRCSTLIFSTSTRSVPRRRRLPTCAATCRRSSWTRWCRWCRRCRSSCQTPTSAWSRAAASPSPAWYPPLRPVSLPCPFPCPGGPDHTARSRACCPRPAHLPAPLPPCQDGECPRGTGRACAGRGRSARRRLHTPPPSGPHTTPSRPSHHPQPALTPPPAGPHTRTRTRARAHGAGGVVWGGPWGGGRAGGPRDAPPPGRPRLPRRPPGQWRPAGSRGPRRRLAARGPALARVGPRGAAGGAGMRRRGGADTERGCAGAVPVRRARPRRPGSVRAGGFRAGIRINLFAGGRGIPRAGSVEGVSWSELACGAGTTAAHSHPTPTHPPDDAAGRSAA